MVGVQRTIFLICLVLSLFVTSCARESGDTSPQFEASSFHVVKESENTKNIILVTQDNVALSARYYRTKDDTSKNVLLLHMLNGKKEDWDGFAQFLQKKNIRVLAIDLRGHGQSSGDRKTFAEKDFRAMIYDVAIAKDYLYNETRTRRFSLLGARNGANVIGEYIDEYGTQNVERIVLLSPGENYRGLEVRGVDIFRNGVLVVASNEDGYSVNATRELKEELSPIQTILYSDAGHGTEMLKNKPELWDEIAAFLLE